MLKEALFTLKFMAQQRHKHERSPSVIGGSYEINLTSVNSVAGL